MTIYGWDASNHDWGRGSVDVAAAVKDGISFATHKIGEGTSYTDRCFAEFYRRARAARVPLLGAYYVIHPGNQQAQADRFLALLDAQAPGWRDGPFILQIDAERFDYMPSAPSATECRAFGDRLASVTDGRYRPVLYAPRWLYGDTLRGVGYPLWASNYGGNSAQHYRAAYPGDQSDRWAAYSGQVPAILQYGSLLRVGSQSICDANAFRGTITELIALVYPGGEGKGDIMTKAEITAAVQEALTTALPIPGGPGKRLTAAGWASSISPWALLGYLMEHAVAERDTQVIVREVLAGLDPVAIAAAIPSDLAARVADELGARIGAPSKN